MPLPRHGAVILYPITWGRELGRCFPVTAVPCHISSCHGAIAEPSPASCRISFPLFPRCSQISPGPPGSMKTSLAAEIPGFCPGWRGFYFRQAMALCCTLYFAALCQFGLGWSFWLGLNHGTEGMDTLPELGCSRSTTGLLTPKQPCSASSQSIPTGKTPLCKALCPHSSPARMAQEVLLGWAGLRKETSLTLHPWASLCIPGHNTDPQGKQRREGLTELPKSCD